MALLPPGVKALGLAFGEVMRHVVAPSAFVFVVFVAMLVAIRVTWVRDSRFGGEDSPLRPPMSMLLRQVVATALAGYVIFLAIVAVFHVLVGGGSLSVLAGAASGGAFLAFGIAVPVFVTLSALSRRRSR